MKLAGLEVEVRKEAHGIRLDAYCPECKVLMDTLSIRIVERASGKAVILNNKCPKCKGKFKAILRLN